MLLHTTAYICVASLLQTQLHSCFWSHLTLRSLPPSCHLFLFKKNVIVIHSVGAFTPKRTKSQFRAGARASSKQVPALSQLRTSWFHTGQSQPWSRREQRHDVNANVSAFPATLPPCRSSTIRRRTHAPVSNTTTTISSSIQSVYGSFFEYSDLKQKRTLF